GYFKRRVIFRSESSLPGHPSNDGKDADADDHVYGVHAGQRKVEGKEDLRALLNLGLFFLKLVSLAGVVLRLVESKQLLVIPHQIFGVEVEGRNVVLIVFLVPLVSLDPQED